MPPPSEPPNLTLYSSPISNASARLRIALNLKQLPYNLITINLSKGEQHNPDFKSINPSGTLPLLIHDHTSIGQSIPALEYLDEAFPETKRLMPDDPASKARVRTLVAVLAGDTHPLLTHRVSRAIDEFFPGVEAGVGGENHDAWCRYWCSEGLGKFEKLLEQNGDQGSMKFCVGDEVGLADVVLMPEVWFARRIGVDTSVFPLVQGVCERLCLIEDVRKEEQRLE